MGAPVYGEILFGAKWRAAEHGTYEVIDPSNGEVAGHAPACDPGQVLQATRRAREAFEKGPWPRMSGAERGRLLQEAADEWRQRIPKLVDLTIAETGALKSIAATLQLGQGAVRLERYGELAALPAEEGMPAFEVNHPKLGKSLGAGMIVREPVGVVACITPFNFPVTNCAGKIGPALACGNTVVVKPAPQDPLAVAELCRVVDSVLPPGVVSFVCGPGADVGEALVRSPDVDMVSFTGSTAVGAKIREAVGGRMVRTLMELGGKSANVVFADADLDRALVGAMSVWTFHSGQICTAPTRLLVEESIYDDFTKRLAAAGASLRVGDPREDGVVVGPLISKAQLERVERFVAGGVGEGAAVACGGKRPAGLARGFYYEPTLLTGARNDMTVAREEVFGPVITAIPFRGEAEAVELANDSDYGLYGYVWSRDSTKALRVARAMRTGTVQINGAPPNPEAPFGGYKRSGVGRDGGRFGLAAYSELKYVGWTA